MDRTFAAVLACFTLSGLAGLLYQTAWTREFAFVFGTSELAVATVLAAYMAGLALGARLAGRWVDRIRRPIFVYGALELGIGVSALAVPKAIAASTLLCAALFGQSDAPPDAGESAIALYYLAASFVILLVPTSLMGATLPLLARYAVRTDAEVGSRIGTLYAINTAGAVLGTLLAGFVLLPWLGLLRTLWCGVLVNFAVFAIAARLSQSSPPVPPSEARLVDRPRWRRVDWILPLMLFSGLTSFAYEVLWTRLFAQLIGGSVYAFSTMLATFLFGIALGSAYAARRATDVERSVAGFGIAQVAIAALTLGAFSCMQWLPMWANQIAAIAPIRLGGVFVTDIILAGALLLPSTLAIGATFPFAVRIVASASEDAGPASARVYAWNTSGAIVGAVGAGFYLIPALGFAGAVGILAGINLVLAMAAGALARPLRVTIPVAVGCVAIAASLIQPTTPWHLLRFNPLGRNINGGDLVFAEVGRSATVLLFETPGQWRLTSNGLAESSIRDSDHSSGDLTPRWLGALPTLARPSTRSMLVVGFGGGQLLEDIPKTVERVDVVELEPAVVNANRSIAAARYSDPLSDSRIRVIENDARGALMLTDRRYDAIVSQPSHPWTAGASHLYTREFFALADAHLERDGVFVQWIGSGFVNLRLLRVLIATLQDVFPHVRVYRPPPLGAFLFIASRSPLPVEQNVVAAVEGSRTSFRRMGIEVPEDVAIQLGLDEPAARAFARGAPVSRDDSNILQIESPRVAGAGLAKSQVDGLFSRFRVEQRRPSSIDSVLLADRLLYSRSTDAADASAPLLGMLEQLHDEAGSPAQRELVRALLSAAMGRVPDAISRVEAVMNGDRDGDAKSRRQATALWARLRRSAVEDGVEAVMARTASLPEAERAVVKGWSAIAGRGAQELRDLETQLARIGPRSLVYRDALRLRARWRVDSQDALLAKEAVALMNRITAGTGGTSRDFALRANAALEAGELSTAVASLTRSIRRLKRDREPERARTEARSVLDRIPPTVRYAGVLDELRELVGSDAR